MRRNSKRALAMILPAFAMASVIGAGYSTWYFGETTTTTSGDNSIQLVVEGYTDIGVLQITEASATLTLDQRTGDHDTGSVAANGNSNGLIFSGNVKYVHSGTTTIDDVPNDTNGNNYVFHVADYDYSITFTYEGGITSYVKFETDTPESTKTYTDVEKTYIAPTAAGEAGAVTLDITKLEELMHPVWVDVPESAGEYANMLTAVRGSTIKIKVTAEYNPVD